MDYTFVSQFSADGPKRRRLAKACKLCRARKKRCVHFATNLAGKPVHSGSQNGDESRHQSSTESTSPAFSGDNHTPRSLSNGMVSHTGTTKGKKSSQRRSSLSALMGSTAHHFISHLHPESSFLQRKSTDAAHPQAKSMDNVGVWVDRREWEDLVRQRDSANAGALSETQSHTSADTNHGSSRLHAFQINALIDIFFQKFHPILPIIDEDEFRQAHAGGIVPEPFVHALCLVAAKDKDAHTPDAMSPRDFCKYLYLSVKGALASHRYDKITLVRIHSLLSQHSEGPEGAEEASLSISHALHHCQTLGLHLGQQASLPDKNSLSLKRLFWIVWTLDRFNAAMHGRPIVMADRDIAIEPIAKGETDYPAFEILLRIAGIINEVLGYYRPGNPPTVTGWEDMFPSFEEIVDDVNGWDLAPMVLSSLHIAYLATAILSHRSKGVHNQPNKMPSQVRQNVAAFQILRLMRSERLKDLRALPMLPYAISLTLSVSYKQFRQGRLKHMQEDGRADFEACCTILQELRPTWSSVDVMATLAQKVLDELKRAPDPLSSRFQRPSKDQRVIEGFATACRDHDEPVVNGQSNANADPEGPMQLTNGGSMASDIAQQSTAANAMLVPQDIGQGLFEGMDDIFGTYLDPNYPVNLDDLSFLDDLGAVDWAAQGPSG